MHAHLYMCNCARARVCLCVALCVFVCDARANLDAPAKNVKDHLRP